MTQHNNHVLICFGETACRMIDAPDCTLAQIEDYGTVQSFSFGTKEEADAFRLGLAEADGWLGSTEIDQETWDRLYGDKT